MQTQAKLKRLRMAPRKVRLVADMVRGMQADKALLQLTHSPKHAARPVRKLIASAIANAKHNHKIKEDTLVLKTIFVDEGKTLYRYMPRAFGRATPLRKRTCHITVVLEGDVDETATKKTKSADKKKADAKAPVETDDSSVSADEAKKKNTSKADLAKMKKSGPAAKGKGASSKQQKASTRTTNK